MRSWMIGSVALGVTLLFAGGCSTDPPRVAAVKPEEARVALKATLDAWKAGQAIDSLKSANPPIVAQDVDWMQGKKLTAFEVVGEGTPQDANLRCEVKLTLDGAQTEKKVFYIVGTSPRLTVFRAFE